MTDAPLSVGLFRFDLTVTDEIVLPPYKGFAFRGMFGTVLHELACVIPGDACPACPFRHTCTYAYLFETSPADGVDGFRRFSSFPRPYIIHPPRGDKRQFRRYDTMSFEFVMIGRANDCIHQVIMTFEEIGRRGMRNGTGRFLLDRVIAAGDEAQEQIIYRNGAFSGTAVPARNISLLQQMERKVTELTVTFHTPLLLEERGTILTEPPRFDFLFENLLRRITLLQYLHGGGEAETLQIDQLLEQAGRIKIKNADMRWQGMERISNRQQSRIKTGGLLGGITYTGELTPFVPYLRAGELLHVGKSTTFGFGGYIIWIH
ncbi:MAG TPA: CRISPR system precrRNA processing endoribonuclease RAMP protein Cas6 [Desulfuromonadales bacterium]|nr:CRISPR system precrRNA processing endoribonuclease RAMP protein Cas6 [Desulfuromonadales bacterium]